MGNSTKKSINFDLDSENLRKYYSKNRTTAYTEIGRFLKSHGFIHRQYSGYFSKEKMSLKEVIELTKKLYKEFPWLEKCINKLDVTNVGKNHDLIKLYDKLVKNEKESQAPKTTNSHKTYYSASTEDDTFTSMCEQLSNRDTEMAPCVKR